MYVEQYQFVEREFDVASIRVENDNDCYSNIILRTNLLSRRVIVSYYVTMLSNDVYVNGVERADMCEISLIFELG